MSQVDVLYRIQQTEDEIREDKKRLAKVIRMQSESVQLINARNLVTSTKSEVTRLRVKQMDLSLENDGLCDKAKRSEDRLYSGLVTNPKELADLQHEIESLGRRIAILEDDLLEVMMFVEEAENNQEAAVETLNRIESDWQETFDRSKKEQAELMERLAILTDQNSQLFAILHPQSLQAYENAKRRAGDLAVVALKNGRCRGCLLTVSSTKRKVVDEGQMVTCDSCGRILCPM
jgi:predicted  nucleic acid-binding Zn-ribbon protein